MSRSASALIRFSPSAGSGGGESALDRLSLTLTVRLDGTTMSTTSGQRLSTELTIPFAPYSLCARARLVGIAPVGHAPLVLTHAKYTGSTCGYAGPEKTDEPALVYTDFPYSDAEPGETLVIDWPSTDLYPYFQWPSPIIAFDPPLADDEQSPFEADSPLRELLSAHNALRVPQSLSVLGWDEGLADTIGEHLDWLLDRFPSEIDGSATPSPDWNPHEGEGDDLTSGDRAWNDGYPNTSAIGENLSLRARGVSHTMEGWINSPAHFGNMLDPRWQAMGAARRQIPTLPDGYYVFGVLFGEVYRADRSTIDEPSALELVSLTGFAATGLADDPGLQLPMRLIAKRPEHTGEVEVKALIYEEAPGFTGSAESVHPKTSPAWALSARDLAQSLEGAFPDHDPEQPLDLDLYWRIYKGSGEMRYRVECDGSEIPESYADRRDAGIGGGFGTFATTDLLAARLRLEPIPYPFVIYAGSSSGPTQYNIDGAGNSRVRVPGYVADPYAWWGEDPLHDGLVTWNYGGLQMGGRALSRIKIGTFERVLCVCLAVDATGARRVQYLLGPSGDGAGCVVCWPLTLDSAPEIVPAQPLPADGQRRLSIGNVSFSADGRSLVGFVPRGRTTDVDWLPGIVWTTGLIEAVDAEGVSRLELEPWTEIYRDPEPVFDAATFQIEDAEGGWNADFSHYSSSSLETREGSSDALIVGLQWAAWSGNDLVIRTARLKGEGRYRYDETQSIDKERISSNEFGGPGNCLWTRSYDQAWEDARSQIVQLWERVLSSGGSSERLVAERPLTSYSRQFISQGREEGVKRLCAATSPLSQPIVLSYHEQQWNLRLPDAARWAPAPILEIGWSKSDTTLGAPTKNEQSKIAQLRISETATDSPFIEVDYSPVASSLALTSPQHLPVYYGNDVDSLNETLRRLALENFHTLFRVYPDYFLFSAQDPVSGHAVAQLKLAANLPTPLLAMGWTGEMTAPFTDPVPPNVRSTIRLIAPCACIDRPAPEASDP